MARAKALSPWEHSTFEKRKEARRWGWEQRGETPEVLGRWVGMGCEPHRAQCGALCIYAKEFPYIACNRFNSHKGKMLLLFPIYRCGLE